MTKEEEQQIVANLMAPVKAELRRLAALQGQPEWVRDAVAAEPKNFMQDLVNFRRSQSASMISQDQRSDEPPARGNGWVDAPPVKPPPGIDHCDRIADEFARRDQLAAVRERIQRIENEWIEAKLSGHNPYRAKMSYEPFQGFDSDVPSCHRDKDE